MLRISIMVICRASVHDEWEFDVQATVYGLFVTGLHPGYDGALQVGDKILSINESLIPNGAPFRLFTALTQRKTSARLLVERDSNGGGPASMDWILENENDWNNHSSPYSSSHFTTTRDADYLDEADEAVRKRIRRFFTLGYHPLNPSTDSDANDAGTFASVATLRDSRHRRRTNNDTNGDLCSSDSESDDLIGSISSLSPRRSRRRPLPKNFSDVDGPRQKQAEIGDVQRKYDPRDSASIRQSDAAAREILLLIGKNYAEYYIH